MSLSITLRIALKNIFGNRMRSSLTVLGIVIGIASVILLVGLVNGATQSIMQQMSEGGADVISINIWDETKSLDFDDVQEIEKVDKIESVAPYMMASASVTKGGTKAKGTSVLAVGDSYARVMGYDIKAGRDFSFIDIENSTKAAVIGSDIADKYWKKRDPCGDTIKIDTRTGEYAERVNKA